ncbi:MAG: hypothetical protein CL758_00755 [Chloroflexi bacterium]|nr:hypothetical protein [Chloroflexota bacterium]|tara:strand:+ start:9650 stop:10822 length:1173 start_codon:yes stop_codon:yes gene_type:complete
MNDLPLKGIRIVDFSWIIAGPTATRHLALMGAEVIKVGSARRIDPSFKYPPFQVYNQSKKYVSLNISKPEGLNLAKKLVSISDIVIENFAVGVIDRLGLGYESLKECKQDIIMISSSGTGHSGPDKDYVAYGSLLQHYTGWNSISGYPNSEPIKGGLWADPWVGLEIAMLSCAALTDRLLTGQGQYIDFSMSEALTSTLPEAILDYQMNNKIVTPRGNKDRNFVPHGVFKCKGQDRWIAIAVTTDQQWENLCKIMGKEGLIKDEKYSTVKSRILIEDEINELVAQWTIDMEDEEAMEILQSIGIAAGPSLDIGRVYENKQLRDSGYFAPFTNTDGHIRELPLLPWHFADNLELNMTPVPNLGEGNEYVFGDLLGLSEQEILDFKEAQIIY